MIAEEDTTSSKLDSVSTLAKRDSFQKYSFITQAFILTTVVLISLVNLSLPEQKKTDLWISLLTLCVGIILPKSPRFKGTYKKTETVP